MGKDSSNGCFRVYRGTSSLMDWVVKPAIALSPTRHYVAVVIHACAVRLSVGCFAKIG